MNTDVLFDRAFAIRAAKPWQYLFDTHIFAVRFSDGEIACCSVMGRNGTHLALALYSLTDGLYALDKLMTTDMRVLPRHRAEECMLGQDCIQVSFENVQEILAKEAKAVRAYAKAHGISLRGQHNFPVFHRYRPSRWFGLNRGGGHKHRQRPRCTGLLALLQPRQRQFILNFARRECRRVGLLQRVGIPAIAVGGRGQQGNRVREWVALNQPQGKRLFCAEATRYFQQGIHCFQ